MPASSSSAESGGSSGTFEGTADHAGKTIDSVSVNSCGACAAGPSSSEIHADSGSDIVATLDLFFAERHTTQSNFRIDTSIKLENLPDGDSISSMYD